MSDGDGSRPATASPGAELPICRVVTGVVLFADLAGFTSLSESLSRSGPAGTEALTTMLNGCFEILTGEVTTAGGEVTTFAGDALAAVFEDCGSGHTSCAAAARRCAAAVQERLRTWPGVSPDLARPQVRIGLGAGTAVRAVVITSGPWTEEAVARLGAAHAEL